MKKTLAMMSVLLLAGTLLSGCGKKAVEETTAVPADTQGTTQAETETPAAADVYKRQGYGRPCGRDRGVESRRGAVDSGGGGSQVEITAGGITLSPACYDSFKRWYLIKCL